MWNRNGMSDEEILSQFLDESFENIKNFESTLLDFEKNSGNLMLLQSLFRNMHTIKGAASFFSFPNLESVVHKAEDIFSILQKQEEKLRGETINKYDLVELMFNINDNVKNLLETIKSQKTDKNSNTEPLIQQLNTIKTNIETQIQNQSTTSKAKRKLSPIQLEALKNLNLQSSSAPTVDQNHDTQQELELDDNLIIKLKTLETLSNLSSDLILARNKLGSLLDSDSEEVKAILASFHRIDSLTQRLGEKISKIRMQPISTITDRLKRVTRDLAASCGKQVKLNTETNNIELDRIIIEALKDPLIHLIRNAIDHGIETPDERNKQGKPTTGEIIITASCNNNNVILTVSDDGKGIDVNKIKTKALSRNLLDKYKLNTLSEKEILNLIFLPGFSTKDEVTNLSGRGVGMDVVKDSLIKINGSVEIQTEQHKGTNFIIRLPLTLALGTAVIVDVDSRTYAIPSSYVRELRSTSYATIENQEYIEIRDEKYKILYARKHLGKGLKDFNEYYASQDSIEYLLIGTDEVKFAFIVDSIYDLQNLVIKPLPQGSDHLDNYSGATILANGEVALILDMQATYKSYEDLETKLCSLELYNQNHSQKASINNFGKILTFNIGKHLFAIEKELVQEVVANKPVTSIPESKLEGLINLRENIVLTKKLKKLLDIKSRKKRSNVNIIIKMNDARFSVMADDINEILEVSQDWEVLEEIEPNFKGFVKAAFIVKDKPLYILEENICLKAS